MELFWHHAPLVRILAPFLLGLLGALKFDTFSYFKPICIPVILAIIIALFSFNKIWKSMRLNHHFGVLSAILFFLFGAVLGFTAIEKDRSIPEAESYLALIESTPMEKKNSFAVDLKVYQAHLDSGLYQSCNARIIAYISKEDLDLRIAPGNSIHFSRSISNLDQELYPHQFNYGEYLRNIGISGSVYIPSGAYEFIETEQFSLRAKLNGIRGSLLEKMNEDSIPIEEYGVISALLVGDRSSLDPQLRSDFADAGAVHILAVSGLHVGIIYLLFLTILKFIFKKKHALLQFCLILLLLWGYAALTGFSPSVLRAATMFSFIAVGKFHKRYGNIYNMIAASALFLLSINPLLITQVGFQLSYIAVIGIVYFHPKFHALLVVENKYLNMLWSLTCVSLAAQLATFPLSIYYFHQFPTLFLFTNILVIPLASIILHLGIGWILLLWVPWLSDLLEWLTVKFTWLLNAFVRSVNAVPFSKLDGLYFSAVSVLLIYTIIILISAFIAKPNRTSLRFLGVSVIAVSALFINRRISVIFQDDILIPTLSESAVVIRLIQNEVFICTEDTATFNAKWERELYPYLLTQGFRDTESVRYAAFDADNDILSVRKSYPSSNELHILWNRGKEEVKYSGNNDGELISLESNEPILHFESAGLSRFSNE
jgi:competence protein ComEC